MPKKNKSSNMNDCQNCARKAHENVKCGIK